MTCSRCGSTTPLASCYVCCDEMLSDQIDCFSAYKEYADFAQVSAPAERDGVECLPLISPCASMEEA